MKAIFKIDYYLSDQNNIAVKFCGSYSQKSIDEYPTRIVNCDDLDMHDYESFANSLMTKSGKKRIEEQEKKNSILEENKPVKITGKFDIRDLIGKVIEGESENYRRSLIKMRKVDL